MTDVQDLSTGHDRTSLEANIGLSLAQQMGAYIDTLPKSAVVAIMGHMVESWHEEYQQYQDSSRLALCGVEEIDRYYWIKSAHGDSLASLTAEQQKELEQYFELWAKLHRLNIEIPNPFLLEV